MAGFGSLAPTAEPDWRDTEAQLGLALQQADEAKKAAAGRSWGETLRSALGAPGRIFGALASAPASAEADQQAMMPETFQNPLVKNVLGGAGEAVASGATLPGDVMAGNVPMTDIEGHTSPEVIHRAFDLASMAGGGSVAGAAGRVAEDAAKAGAPIAAVAPRSTGFGSLAPARNPLDNADQLAELANQRRSRGMSVGKWAPGWDFKRPDAPKGSWDDTVARTNAQWEADKARAVSGYEEAAGAPPLKSPLLSKDDLEFIKGGGFYSDTAKPGAAVDIAEHALNHPAIRQAFHDEMGPEAGQSAYEAYLASHGPETPPASAAAAPAAPRGDEPGGAGGGDAGLRQAQAEAARRAGAGAPLEGLPTKAMKIGDEHFVPGPIASVRDVAERYMADRPKSAYFPPPAKYYPHDPEHAAAIANAFDEMKHTPNDPATKASYQAMIDETKAQYRAVKASGLKIEPIEPGMPDPYASNPRLAAKDVADNNHLWFFPTDQGFGSNAGSGINMKTHPMMQKTGEKIGDRELVANDLFRVVHDYFGHLKEGYGFRAAGEDNAWRSHASMYSDLARPAMTTETRGQNSWVNFGPHGESNRTASAADTKYADQKVGLMPEWTMRDRGSPEPIIGYHGTPHKFDAFDPAKIGSGEGAQVYGKGLYFAENPKVAKQYRDQLARSQTWEKDGESVPLHHVMGDLVDAMKSSSPAPLHPDQSGEIVRRITDLMDGGKSVASIRKNYAAPAGFEKPWNAALDRAETYTYNRKPGHTFQVAIDQPPEKFLDWDRLFKDQHPDVQAATRPFLEDRLAAMKKAREYAVERANNGDRVAARGLRDWMPPPALENLPGSKIHQMVGLPAVSQEEGFARSAERLKAAGVPGIRYLDQGSRSKKAGAGQTRNYVTFDAPRVLKRYAIPGAIGAGGFGSLAPGKEE